MFKIIDCVHNARKRLMNKFVFTFFFLFCDIFAGADGGCGYCVSDIGIRRRLNICAAFLIDTSECSKCLIDLLSQGGFDSFFFFFLNICIIYSYPSPVERK